MKAQSWQERRREYLEESGKLDRGQVIVMQPRRLTARVEGPRDTVECRADRLTDDDLGGAA